MIIRKMTSNDWETVSRIYQQGLDSGYATFRTACPSWNEWNKSHHKECRFVAVADHQVVGFIATSPVSTNVHYAGVAEVMVYVDESCRRCGIGTLLLQKLMAEAPKHGIWMLYSSIMSSNTKSINLHRKCGFRTIGYRERIAKDKNGEWQNTTLMEYRLPD